MNTIVELYGFSTEEQGVDWNHITNEQNCPYLEKKCYKVRKSNPNISIGSCTIQQKRRLNPIIICPARFIAQRQIFIDCIPFLKNHEPGNEFHIIPEVSIPGGNVDYFLVSTKENKVMDFVAIELQAVDTTGSIWNERQSLLNNLGIHHVEFDVDQNKSYGMNWKMTAKTTLVQLYHKIQTFEYVSKKIILVMQDVLLEYFIRQFNFDHLHNSAIPEDPMQFHVYKMDKQEDNTFKLIMHSRYSTNSLGIEECLGMRTDARVEIDFILQSLEAKISPNNYFNPF